MANALPAAALRGRFRPALLLAAAALATSGGLAACGGDTGDTRAAAKDAPAIGEVKKPVLQASLLGNSDTAGTGGSYEPTGDIVADSGFRPEINGFSFENYGNDVQPANLSTENVQALFGDQVCVGGDGEDCTLIPPARKWMEQENERMGGGHCMGFSVAAIRMFLDSLPPKDFGGEDAAQLKIVNNEALQRSIAEHWVYQDLPNIQQKMVEGTPSEIVDTLADSLNSGKEDYTIGLAKPDWSAGHAITPFALEDKGDGAYAILVYDNNFPGITRAVEVDTNEDTWRYVGGTNPKDLDEVYEGDAETSTLVLFPTSPGEDLQPCPFCRAQEDDSSDGGEFGSVLKGDDQYAELTLTTTSKVEHPHLVISDEEGRQTGIVDGKMLQEIPGVKIAGSFGVQNWESAPEPRFQLPLHKPFNITVDGSNLTRPITSTFDLTGGGLVLSAETVRIAPGQQDSIFVTGEGDGFIYETNAKNEEVPEFYAGLEDGDAAYTLAATAVGLKPGSQVGLFIDRESGTVLVDGADIKGSVDGKGFFGVAVSRVTADGEDTWLRQLTVSGRRKEGIYFNYKEAPKAPASLPLEVGPEDGPFRTVRAKYER